MMGLIKFIQKRPSDKTILGGRILFGLLYVGVMYYNLIYLNKGIDSEYLFGVVVLDAGGVQIAKYVMTALGVIPMFMGLTNICLLKKKHMRIVQVVFGIALFYIAGSIEESANLDFDVLIGFMGLLPLFAGITGKCITSKCLKYREKITKIRV
ncbi:MAG: YgaP-like transmembrane domain [Candidatus Altimarinota bacterium]